MFSKKDSTALICTEYLKKILKYDQFINARIKAITSE